MLTGGRGGLRTLQVAQRRDQAAWPLKSHVDALLSERMETHSTMLVAAQAATPFKLNVLEASAGRRGHVGDLREVGSGPSVHVNARAGRFIADAALARLGKRAGRSKGRRRQTSTSTSPHQTNTVDAQHNEMPLLLHHRARYASAPSLVYGVETVGSQTCRLCDHHALLG